MEFTYSLKDLSKAVAQIFAIGKACKVWAFHAEMGAGKTTFIHELCNYLNVSSTVGSPTYSIINEYTSNTVGTIFHMDLYRLKDEEEALQAGVEDCINSGNYCFIEWPEKAPSLLPDPCFHLSITFINEDTRLVTTHI